MASLDLKQLSAYYDRIKLPAEMRRDDRLASADLELLRALVACQQRTIPFENLSLVHPKARERDGGRIRIDLPSVFEKLVTRHRGGYCFEANSLLAAVLRTLDFWLYTTAARVVLDAEGSEAKAACPSQVALGGLDHQLSLVNLDGEWWAADAGFGSRVAREPVPLRDRPDDAGGDTAPAPTGPQHRVRRGEAGSADPPGKLRQPHRQGWYMQEWSEDKGRWLDQYFFQEVEFFPRDYEIANNWTATCPDVMFTQTTVVAIQTEAGRVRLFGDTLRVFERPAPHEPLALIEERELRDDAERDAALEQYFGLNV